MIIITRVYMSSFLEETGQHMPPEMLGLVYRKANAATQVRMRATGRAVAGNRGMPAPSYLNGRGRYQREYDSFVKRARVAIAIESKRIGYTRDDVLEPLYWGIHWFEWIHTNLVRRKITDPSALLENSTFRDEFWDVFIAPHVTGTPRTVNGLIDRFIRGLDPAFAEARDTFITTPTTRALTAYMKADRVKDALPDPNVRDLRRRRRLYRVQARSRQ
jgi:hypothetical protein